jgi:DNA-directed RNA polymerase specialized sigma24 family protein
MGKFRQEDRMNAPEWPREELVELQVLFQRLRHTPSALGRRRLAYQIVLHRAAMRRLTAASDRFRKRFADRPADFDEFLQETLLRLVSRLSVESFSFQDLGIERFAAWYWTLCKNSCRDALEKCSVSKFVSLDRLNDEELPLVPEPSLFELWWDDVLLAISRIRSRTVRAVMIDTAAGISERQTAQTYNMSVANVSKLRRKGIMLVRRSCLGSVANHS